MDAIEAYIRDAAAKRGIDPEIAVRVARSEGLGPGIYQSNFRKNGVREPSFGPFQLLVGGDDTGYPTGMGNDFINKTGLDPRDPSTVNAQIDFALDGAKTTGWKPWYGAKRVGIDPWEGIKGMRDAPPVLNMKPGEDMMARTEATKQVPMSPADAAPEQSPLGNALGNLMSGFANMGAQQQQPAGPRVLQDDSAQAIAAAQGLKERGAGLKSALTPDVTSLMAMGKRPPSGVI